MKYLINIFFIILAISTTAQEPATDAIYHKIVKEYTLNEDGSIDFHYYKKMKYLTPYSFNRLYGETFIVYNPEFQEISINMAVTTQEDGLVVQNPKNAFNEVLPRFAANNAIYNHLRELVVTHAGLEVNAIVELDYTIHSKSGYYSALSGMETIKENVPVNEEVIIFSVPEEVNFNYKVLNMRKSPEITSENGQNIYQFSFNGLTAKVGVHESFTPQYGTDQSQILFSTETILNFYNSFTTQQAFQYEVNESMKSLVKENKKDIKDDISLALKLQKIAADKTNYYPVPLIYAGNKVHTAIETYNSNGGTQLEKCILLTALLRESGINAEPVMVIPEDFYVENIGGIFPSCEFLVQVNPRETKQLYISATHFDSQNLIFSLSDKTVFTLNQSKPLRIEKIEKVENKIVLSGEIIFSDSLKFTGLLDLVVSGNTNPFFSLKEDSVFTKKMIAGDISGKNIVKYEINSLEQLQSEISYSIENNAPMNNHKNYSFFTIPTYKLGIASWKMNYFLDTRNATLQVPTLISEQYDFELILPDGVQLINSMERLERHSEFGNLTLEISQNQNKVIINRSIEILQNEIPVASYKDFKEMMDLWNEKNFRKLVLKSTD